MPYILRVIFGKIGAEAIP